MSIPVDLLAAAVEALRAAEKANEGLYAALKGTNYVINDVSKLPGAQTLGIYNTMDDVEVELEAIKDARRITAVANVIATYERNRVWAEAIAAVERTYVPKPGSAPQSSLDIMKTVSLEELVITGAIRSKDEAISTVKRAMARDKAAHGEESDVPLKGA